VLVVTEPIVEVGVQVLNALIEVTNHTKLHVEVTSFVRYTNELYIYET
jgi:hypothetical protein